MNKSNTASASHNIDVSMIDFEVEYALWTTEPPHDPNKDQMNVMDMSINEESITLARKQKSINNKNHTMQTVRGQPIDRIHFLHKSVGQGSL